MEVYTAGAWSVLLILVACTIITYVFLRHGPDDSKTANEFRAVTTGLTSLNNTPVPGRTPDTFRMLMDCLKVEMRGRSQTFATLGEFDTCLKRLGVED